MFMFWKFKYKSQFEKNIHCTSSLKQNACFALVESHLRYDIDIQIRAAETNLEKVLNQLKRAIRCFVTMYHLDSCKELLKHFNTVVSLSIRETITYTQSTHSNQDKDILNTFLLNTSLIKPLQNETVLLQRSSLLQSPS